MKKLLFVLLILNLCTLTAFAENIDIKMKYDIDTNQLHIYGNIKDEKSNEPLSAILKYNGYIIDIRNTKSKKENGDVIFDFEPFKFSDISNSGEYTVIVSSAFNHMQSEDVYNYSSVTDILDFFGKYQTYCEQTDYEACVNLIKTSKNLIMNYKTFEELTDKAQLHCMQVMSHNVYTLPSGHTTTEDKKQIRVLFGKFENDLYEMAAVTSISDCSSKEQFEQRVKKYNEVIGFSTESDVSEESEENLYKYVQKAFEFSDFYQRVKNVDYSQNKKEILMTVYEQALLSVIQNAHSSQTKIVITEYPAIFKIDTMEFDKLSSAQKENVYIGIANKKYESIEDMRKAFDAEVKKYSSKDDSTVKGGGGNSSSVSERGTIPSSQVIKNNENETEKGYFSDLDNYGWAKTAINYLYDKKIVNGRTSQTFAPGDYITRAEFVKMVVTAYFPVLSSNEKSIFEDVSEQAWYSDYVNTAWKNKIITGYNGKFYPNDNITREDIATILFRLCDKKPDAGSFRFADNDNISEYAVDSVYGLYANGVILGTDNNTFLPKSKAKRAETAQMLYKMLIAAK